MPRSVASQRVKSCARTRIVVNQSKNGCLTCKERRIKCDETAPACLRCIRSRKQCQGYPGRAPSNAMLRNVPSLSLSLGLIISPEHARLAEIGFSTLSFDLEGNWESQSPIMTTLARQLNSVIPSVSAAVAAFGAAYESILMPHVGPRPGVFQAERYYGMALRFLQSDIENQPQRFESLFLTCCFLLFADLIHRRQQSALAHLQGIMKILWQQKYLEADSQIEAENQKACQAPGTLRQNDNWRDNTPLAFDSPFISAVKRMDIQSASYTLLAPEIPPSPPNELLPSSRPFSTLVEAKTHLVQLLHACYHFAGKASQLKYLPRQRHSPETLIDQGRYIAQLSSWLSRMNLFLVQTNASPNNRLTPGSLAHALCQRAQCRSALIYVSMVLCAFEKAYDFYLSDFQSIVADAFVVLDHHRRCTQHFRYFRADPGIIQPLYLTTLKCRDSPTRTRAMELMRSAGREGPFYGPILASVALRAIEIEEGCSIPSEKPCSSQDQVPECARLHGAGIDAEGNLDGKPKPFVEVTFSRCIDVNYMITGEIQWDDSRHWDKWDEIITFAVS